MDAEEDFKHFEKFILKCEESVGRVRKLKKIVSGEQVNCEVDSFKE